MRLKQVMLNLLSNAFKFTDLGKVDLTVSRREAAPYTNEVPGDWLVFKVTDTGIGINPDRTEMLFDEFVQADDETTAK